jgi:MEDS: MEthanogen/methylotroph, DcmR Sensory domain
MLVSSFKAGLEENEFCVWVVSEPLSEREAWDGLRKAVPEFDDYVSNRSIEPRVMTAWNEKIDRALDRGYAGLGGSASCDIHIDDDSSQTSKRILVAQILASVWVDHPRPESFLCTDWLVRASANRVVTASLSTPAHLRTYEQRLSSSATLGWITHQFSAR